MVNLKKCVILRYTLRAFSGVVSMNSVSKFSTSFEK